MPPRQKRKKLATLPETKPGVVWQSDARRGGGNNRQAPTRLESRGRLANERWKLLNGLVDVVNETGGLGHDFRHDRVGQFDIAGLGRIGLDRCHMQLRTYKSAIA